MKKVIIALLIVLIPASLFAGFNFALGGNVSYDKTIKEFKEKETYGFSDLTFSAEARANLKLWETDLLLGVGKNNDYEKDDDKTAVSNFFRGLRYEALLATGLHFDIANTVRLGVTVGEKFTAKIDDDKFTFYNGTTTFTDFGKALKGSELVLRLTADGKIGNVLVGLNTTSDLGFTFDTIKAINKTDYFKKLVNSTSFGVFVGVQLF